MPTSTTSPASAAAIPSRVIPRRGAARSRSWKRCRSRWWRRSTGRRGAVAASCRSRARCRVASERAHFGQPEVSVGIIPGAGGTQRLPRLIGAGRAAELVLSARIIDADEALRIGLVEAVLPTDGFVERGARVGATDGDQAPARVVRSEARGDRRAAAPRSTKGCASKVGCSSSARSAPTPWPCRPRVADAERERPPDQRVDL